MVLWGFVLDYVGIMGLCRHNGKCSHFVDGYGMVVIGFPLLPGLIADRLLIAMTRSSDVAKE